MAMSTSSSNTMSKRARSNATSDTEVDPNNASFSETSRHKRQRHTGNNDGNSEDIWDAAVEEPSGGDVPSMPEASSQPANGGVVHLNTEQCRQKFVKKLGTPILIQWHSAL